VNPSWAVIRLTLALGRRPAWASMSDEPVMRVARSWIVPASPFQ
jgi:hypothetical protein